MKNQQTVRINTECDITFFVPCYNEECNIIPTFENILGAVKEADVSYEILVVDDSSQDNTVRVLENYIQTNPEVPVVFVKNQKNMYQHLWV